MVAFTAVGTSCLMGCGAPPDTDRPVAAGFDSFELPEIVSITPTTLLPGTKLFVKGKGFVPSQIGAMELKLVGSIHGTQASVTLPASYVSPNLLHVVWPGAAKASIDPEPGSWQVLAKAVIRDTNGKSYFTPSFGVTLDLASSLTPSIDSVNQGLAYINDQIEIKGDGFLLGGDEGRTYVRVKGCFRAGSAGDCVHVTAQELAASPIQPTDRTRLSFPFTPSIVGIRPGAFSGSVTIVNRPADAVGDTSSNEAPVEYELMSAEITGISPQAAGLGQFIGIEGGGFAGTPATGSSQGGGDEGITTLHLKGTYKSNRSMVESPIAIDVVPEFVNGNQLRYLISDNDQLGQIALPRESSGTFTGTIRPTVQYQGDTVDGPVFSAQFQVTAIKQVIWVRFEDAYIGSLRHFGLRAVDHLIRDRVFAVARRDYDGVNIEFRAEEPNDIMLYARVDIGGHDPNGVGMLGYDNSPGKDVNNMRLYDKIGGVNAQTQEDGFPGYGGVFVESFFGFSEHPGTLARSTSQASPFFDAIFDVFRPDRGGSPVRASDFQELTIPQLTSADNCPAVDKSDRGLQVACAVWVLGSMIGSTMTHEVGHSLGLADPYGSEFHNRGDGVNRLMDGGGNRPYLERAEILGAGPAMFCDADYDYLRRILPGPAPSEPRKRPPCN